MRTSVLIALLAVSFTAVLAASHQTHVSVHKITAHHQLKNLALPKFAVAPKSPIGDLIELIGLIIGIDVNAVIEQAGLTVQEIEAALISAAEQLAEVTARVDEELALEVEALLNAAVAEALEILQPLLDVLAPLIPDSGNKRAIAALPNSLLDELLKLLLGVTLEELVALVEKTVTDLEALAVRTVGQIDEIALRLSQELQAEVDRITAEAEARIAAAIAPLLELLKPILPPPETHAVAPKIDLPELIALVSQAIADIEAGIVQAEADLLALLQGTEIFDDLSKMLQGYKDNISETISTALEQAINTPIEELPALVESTISTVAIYAIECRINVLLLINYRAPEIIPQIEEITLQLEIVIKAAIQPLIDLITSPESSAVAPKIDLPELIALVSKAVADIEAAFARAYAALVPLLEDAEILQALNNMLQDYKDKISETISTALEQALKTPIEELPALVTSTVSTVTIYVIECRINVIFLINFQAPEILPQFGEILTQLETDIQVALQPLIDLITPPESRAVVKSVTLPELVELIRVAITQVSDAITTASSALEELLSGTDIIGDVLDLVVVAEAEALRLIEEAVAEALKTPVEELPALLERLTVSLQTLLTNTIAEIQVVVGRDAEELLQGLDAIVAQLAVDVGAALQPIIDALKPESH